MKRLLSALLIGSSLSPAYAADHPRRGALIAPAPFAVAPAFTWTGFYVGVNGGYATTDIEARGVVLSRDLSVSLGPNGFVGGAQAGYNHQIGSVVLGLEADIQASGLSEAATFSASIPGTTLSGIGSARAEVDWFGTVRARLGYAAGTVMPYVTGGLIYGGVNASISASVAGTVAGLPVSFTDTVSPSQTVAYWIAGGGVEIALTPNLSARAEYLFSNLELEVRYTNADLAGEIKLDLQIARAGLNYRF